MYGDGYNPPAGTEIKTPERGPEFALQMFREDSAVEAESGSHRAGPWPGRAIRKLQDCLGYSTKTT